MEIHLLVWNCGILRVVANWDTSKLFGITEIDHVLVDKKALSVIFEF